MIRARLCNAASRAAAMATVAVCLTASKVDADPTIYAFGDSLTDTGNVFLLSGGTEPPFGGPRYSNGPVYVEVLADELGLARPSPSRLGGTNFAHGSARTGAGQSPLLFPSGPALLVDNIGAQVATFLGRGIGLGPDDLVVFSGGGNNIFELLLANADPVQAAASVVASAGELAAAIDAIAGVGGRRFVVANVPMLGQTPAVASFGPAAVNAANGLSALFNQALGAQLDARASNPSLGLTFYRLDLAGITAAAVADPSRFGLTNVTDPAVAALASGADPDRYLFWDPIHPTAVGHRLIGQVAAQQVIPEPSSLALSGIGAALGLVAVSRRRRRDG